MDIGEEELKSYHDLYNLIQNSTRRSLLAYIYQEPRNYTQLIEFSDLKPGSLYHHLNVMNPLVEKKDHGLYGITEMGRRVAEDIELIDQRKPKIRGITGYTTDGEHRTNDPPADIKIQATDETINQILFLGTPNYIITFMILGITLGLATQGIALAGIAIYNSPIPLVFDIVAFCMGLFALYLIEQLVFQTVPYRRWWYALIIRLISMLPAAVIGVSLLLLYLSGVIMNPAIFPYLFALTSFIGYYLITIGLKYLRGMGERQAIGVATIPAGIDLLMGLVVLLME